MRAIAAVVVVLALSVNGPGQERPDLSGNWVATSDPPSGAAPAPNPLFTAKFSIRHRGSSLTLLRTTRNEVVESTFTIGGGETHVRVPFAARQRD